MNIDLTDYDLIVISTSAGKDSQAMLDQVADLAFGAGVSDRLVAVHADLGRVEWPGTKELAAEQAANYKIPFAIVKKVDTKKAPADLLDRVRVRGMWPSSAARWCTSDHKRGPIRKHFTQLARGWAERNPNAGRPCRILSCMGMRAQESPARAKRPVFVPGIVATRNQVVDEWNPIHHWTEERVWERIKQTGVRHHPAYDAGMPRLSCSFCVLASRSALVTAARLRPELAAEYLAVEEETGHDFRQDLPMREVVELAASEVAVEIENWTA